MPSLIKPIYIPYLSRDAFSTKLCRFSGYKIYPGHGRRCSARTDTKCESAFLSNKTGLSSTEETQRAVRFQRAITGASFDDLMAKRNQNPKKPEVRKAQQDQAIQTAKEAKKAKQVSKKRVMAAAKTPTNAVPKQKIVKSVKISAPLVGRKC
ncbi:LOW QUALITY PROTEIN: large ribosomal subunit protein eL24-like [Thomomys bottae]